MSVAVRRTWLDRTIGSVSPAWMLKRMRNRMLADVIERHYEGASQGRRGQGWRRSSGDANAAIGPALANLRDRARDLVRNNPYAESALSTIADHGVGWGLQASAVPENTAAAAAWTEWADTTACDADGRNDLYGLQKLVLRTVVESGEVLVRLRIRRPEDKIPLSIQLQVLDPDFLDTSKTMALQTGGQIIQGVEFDPIGRRAAYWLFPEHPGASALGAAVTIGTSNQSQRVPAEFVRHIFKQLRPGQVRGVTWFAPVLLRFRDFDDLEDAQLMKQKIAACLAVIKSDPSGSNAPIGTQPDGHPEWDMLEPGAVMSTGPGENVTVVNPPRVDGYAEYSKTVLRAIATGIGVNYEDLTGDYDNMPFSAARMSRLRHWDRVEDWRWRLLIPQFCDPVWTWAMQAAAVDGRLGNAAPVAEWTGKPAPFVDPANEGLAMVRNVRGGLQSWSEAVRERGYDPKKLLAEIKADFERFESEGIVLDCDPRHMTQAGQLQATPAATAPVATEPPPAA